MSKIIKKITLIILFITIILGMYGSVNADTAKTPTNIYTHCNKCNKVIYIEGYGQQTVICTNNDCKIDTNNDGVKETYYSFSFNATTANTGMTTKTFTTSDLGQNRLMPERNSNGLTGLFAQYYLGTTGRNVTYDDKRYNLENDDMWTVEIDGQIVYCAQRGTYLRYGFKDIGTDHFLYPGGIKIQSVNVPVSGTTISEGKETVRQEVKDQYMSDFLSDVKDEINIKMMNNPKLKIEIVSNAVVFQGYSTNITDKKIENASAIILGPSMWRKILQTDKFPEGIPSSTITDIVKVTAKEKARDTLVDILEYLDSAFSPASWSTSVDGSDYKYIDNEQQITVENGPEVLVLEDSQGLGYHEGTSSEYDTESTNDKNKIRKALILTAIENAYKYETGNIGQKYTLNDIQSAYWLLLHKYEGGKDPSNGHCTDKGEKLFKEAELYADYIIKLKNNDYKVEIDNSQAKVIADRANQQYYVGPFSIDYDHLIIKDNNNEEISYEDLSYIKALTLTTADGQELIYSDVNSANNKTFDIVLDNAGIKNNGLSKKFPTPNQKFFIKFKAADANYPDGIKLGVTCEYLDSASIDTTTLTTQGSVYQYRGNILEGTVSYSVQCQIKITETLKKYKHKDSCITNQSHSRYDTPIKCPLCSNGEEISVTNTSYETKVKQFDNGYGTMTSLKTYNVYVPYIYMKEDPIATGIDAQDLIIADNGKRTYKTAEDEIDEFIDLTMQLGGKVWEDKKSGKENIENGKFDDGENLIPNVIVTLYDENGNKVQNSVKTDENGEYLFKGLNAMFKYYVQFTYNGQYYQPTTYTSPLPIEEGNGWGTANWANNSNATDKISERLALNAKFETIGSTPNNYKNDNGTYSKTYLKTELGIKEDGTLETNSIIDQYGNLINEQGDSSKVAYVKDCLISAYTGKDNLSTGQYDMDLYPTPDIFSVDDEPVLNREFLGLTIRKLYPAANYINLGLQRREDADIAIKKDVSKVTLEINGQTHEYTYDTLENKQDAENTWEIGVRVSDAYYNTEYTRELYKSDYLYKASNYGDAAKQAELGKSKDDELQVYVTYKVMIRNQSLSIKTRINEIVDYFDKDYEYVDERSYIRIANGANSGTYKVNSKANSMYGTTTESTIDGYDKIYVQGLGVNAQKVNDTDGKTTNTIADGIYLEGGQTAYIYLTFKVKKEVVDGEEWIKLDEDKLTGEVKEFGVGKENIVELNGYSTRYAKGTTIPNVFEVDENGNKQLKDLGDTPAGLVDRDSNPGNLNPVDVPKDGTIKYDNFEDDTDKAPNIRIRLNRDDNDVRVISGSVWEDEKTKKLEVTTIGDGIKADKETLINGVTVQLVEIMKNGTEFVWREFGSDKTGPNSIGQGTGTGTKTTETPIINAFNLVKNYEFGENKDGRYAFKSFVPGKYVVRFIYGDTIRTVTPESLSLGGLNKKSYNGQDYKSTTYQSGVVQNNVYTWREDSTWNNGKEILGKILTSVYTFKEDASNNETLNLKANQNDAQLNNKYAYLYDVLAAEMVKNNVSDAKDIASRRNEVNNYSDDNVTNYISEVLASHKSDYTTMNDRAQLLKDLMQNTKMVAETGLMVVEFEKGLIESDGTVNNSYHISNVDLGLEERPKAQIAMNKEVTNVKLTLADGSILFDATNTAPNVLWKDHKEYEDGYKNNLMDPGKFTSIASIREANSNKFGIVQLSMDEELMHGATIKISYKITVTNIGEVDYIDNEYYYKGKQPLENAKVVTTRVDKVIDYVANNLQFYAKDNPNWKVIKAEDIKSQGLVNSKLHNEIDKFNTIIITEDLAANLVPSIIAKKTNMQDSISVPLVLTQLITTENDGDDLTYRNIAEVVQITNTAGRRQEFSVLGNQNPTEEPQELDTDRSEIVKILPPFGNAGIYIIIAIITILTAGILTGGILFIKKKVLKK